MPPLPPLPPLTAWKAQWSRPVLRYSMDKTNREFSGRVLLVNPKLANKFVRALRLREKEIVIEAFPGPGVITRALLNGGRDEKDKDLEGNKPSVVVACEPSPRLLVEGLGMSQDKVPEELPARFESEDHSVYHSTVYQSQHEPRLLLSPSTPYRWPTLSQLLSDSLVKPHMPIYNGPDNDKLSEQEREMGQRPWDAPSPAITVVSQMPDSVAGDQMVAQWIGSAAGSTMLDRTWIWKWGRVRLALFVGKNLYDRLMAGPGETIHCKLSVITQALFHISPLPPYHHVFNVDKSSHRTEDAPIIRKAKNSTKPLVPIIHPPPQSHPPTITYPDDFYPIQIGLNKHLDIPLARPQILGVLLEPRVNSPITMDNKDEWDYVLRKCFVTEAQSIKAALKNLAFGGEGLMGKIEGSVDDGKFKGRGVASGRIVRDMQVEEWERVVDVFKRWAFKPDNLILESRAPEETRQIGQD